MIDGLALVSAVWLSFVEAAFAVSHFGLLYRTEKSREG